MESACRYGTDKPDLRFGLPMATINAAVRGCGFKIFADTVDKGGTVKALVVPEVCAAAELPDRAQTVGMHGAGCCAL